MRGSEIFEDYYELTSVLLGLVTFHILYCHRP